MVSVLLFLVKLMTQLLKTCCLSNELFRFYYKALLRSLLSWVSCLIIFRKDTGANCIENKNFIFFFKFTR